MIPVLAVLALAALIAYGRRPLTSRGSGRLAIALLAVATAASAVYEGLRGVWLGAVILIGAAAWLGASARAQTPPSAMARRDAAAMLGVAETASREEIDAAYRRLMLRVHPDQGGAPGLAAQLNAARAVLLRR
ncbi:MAG TPA: J domain-containing protein [Caulobacteraceae bacterium]|nr:J domain-containing protein [Caulobacteraceae bacterium]